MYILKNAMVNVKRTKGKNILIGLIIMIIGFSICIAISINKAADKLVESYKTSNPLEVSFSLDKSSLRNGSDTDKQSFKSLTESEVKKYGNSKYVKDYYYTNEVSLSSSSIDAVSDDDLTKTDNEKESQNSESRGPGMDTGDFRLTGYSDPAYISDFIDGTNKITSGCMFDKDVTDKVIVISEDLAEENDLKVGDNVSFYSSSDEDTKYTFKIVGIYKSSKDDNDSNFMKMNAMNSSNQMYTNIISVSEINSNSENTNPMNGINGKYYLTSNKALDKFEKEVKSKGLSSYYNVNTNEDEVLQELKPIQNLQSFSTTFVIIIVIVGIIIITIINLINIRERKYEIGVLRSIGMSKLKLSLQLLSELLIIAMLAIILSSALGAITTKPISNKILSSEIKKLTEEKEDLSSNFGKEGFERPGFNNDGKNSNKNVEYVDNLEVKVSVVTIAQIFILTIVITGLSGVVSILFISRFEPNKILQNRG